MTIECIVPLVLYQIVHFLKRLSYPLLMLTTFCNFYLIIGTWGIWTYSSSHVVFRGFFYSKSQHITFSYYHKLYEHNDNYIDLAFVSITIITLYSHNYDSRTLLQGSWFWQKTEKCDRLQVKVMQAFLSNVVKFHFQFI